MGEWKLWDRSKGSFWKNSKYPEKIPDRMLLKRRKLLSYIPTAKL
jgi:hypothetical protein